MYVPLHCQDRRRLGNLDNDIDDLLIFEKRQTAISRADIALRLVSVRSHTRVSRAHQRPQSTLDTHDQSLITRLHAVQAEQFRHL